MEHSGAERPRRQLDDGVDGRHQNRYLIRFGPVYFDVRSYLGCHRNFPCARRAEQMLNATILPHLPPTIYGPQEIASLHRQPRLDESRRRLRASEIRALAGVGYKSVRQLY